MDERWVTKPNRAELIEDMTWSTQDAWMHAGGWVYASSSFDKSILVEEDQFDKQTATPESTARTQNVVPGTRNVPSTSNTTTNSTGEFADDIGVGTITYNLFVPDLKEESSSQPFTIEKTNAFTRPVITQALSAARQSQSIPNKEQIMFAWEDMQIESLHWFSQYNGGIQWLLFETTNYGLYHFQGSTGPVKPWRVIYDVDGKAYNGQSYGKSRTIFDTPWEGTMFHTFAGRVYMVNGYDIPLCFDGRKVTRAGFSRAASFVQPEIISEDRGKTYIKEDDSNIGLGYSGVKSAYKWKIGFVNERGQMSALSEIGIELSWENKDEDSDKAYASIVLNIPRGPAGTVARRIYRTQNLMNSLGEYRTAEYPLQGTLGFGDEYYFLTEVQDNITEIMVDHLADIHLGSLVSQNLFGNWPTTVNRIASFKDTMFVANNTESYISFSAARRPEEFPPDNVIEIGDSIAGPITAIHSTQNALVVFKSRGIYLIKGDPLNGFFAFTLTKDVGCVAAKSIKEIPGQGLGFLGSDGVYLLVGALENTGTPTNVVRIGQPLEKISSKINYAAAANIRSTINYKDREYWLLVPVDGDVTPSMLLKFHYEIGEWSTVPNFFIKCMTTTADHRDYVYLGSNSSSSSECGLHVYTKASTTKGSYDVSPKYVTSNISINSIYDSFSVVRVQAHAISYGDNDLKLNFSVNRTSTDAYSTALSRNQKRPLEQKNNPIFGTTVWDTTSTTFKDHVPVPIRFDVTQMHKGPTQEIQFTFTPESSRLQILSYQMECKVGTARKVVNLTDKFGGSLTR